MANWRRKLARPIGVADGQILHTLLDASAFMLGLPEDAQVRTVWQEAADLLVKAADSGDKNDIGLATVQIERALLDDGR